MSTSCKHCISCIQCVNILYTCNTQVMFYFPLAPYFRALYSRADLQPYLLFNCGERPTEHVSHSRGFKKKLLDNPHMNGDTRNLGLLATTDGVPFFDDQKRGGWPFILRVANLPDGLSMHPANCHLSLLSANDRWEHDPATNALRRASVAPKSLMPHLTVLVDDLLNAYVRGVTCVDATVKPGLPHRLFVCRAVLLYFTGDYPALAKVSGTHEQMCHWCTRNPGWSPEVSRKCWDGFWMFLRKYVCTLCMLHTHIMFDCVHPVHRVKQCERPVNTFVSCAHPVDNYVEILCEYVLCTSCAQGYAMCTSCSHICIMCTSC